VDKPDPEAAASEQDKTQEAACGLVISGGDASLLLEMADEALDALLPECRTSPIPGWQ
jgi:hypothetical protein